MSARREARARVPVEVRTKGHVPAALAIGRCIEVWADPAVEFAHYSAMRRFGVAREHWGHLMGLNDLELQDAISHGAPWSADYLIDTGRGDYVLERFARADCTPSDIPDLQADAARLLRQAKRSKTT